MHRAIGQFSILVNCRPMIVLLSYKILSTTDHNSSTDNCWCCIKVYIKLLTFNIPIVTNVHCQIIADNLTNANKSLAQITDHNLTILEKSLEKINLSILLKKSLVLSERRTYTNSKEIKKKHTGRKELKKDARGTRCACRHLFRIEDVLVQKSRTYVAIEDLCGDFDLFRGEY